MRALVALLCYRSLVGRLDSVVPLCVLAEQSLTLLLCQNDLSMVSVPALRYQVSGQAFADRDS